MTFLHPIWLLLALPLCAAVWRWPLPSRLLVMLRLAVVLLLVLALGGLAVRLPGRAGTVVVVADRSRSMPGDSTEAQEGAIDLVQAAMAADERLAVVTFGQKTAMERLPMSGKFTGFHHEVGRDASNLAEAVDTALALIPPDTPGKILLLTDGYWTGKDPAGVAARAASRNVALDYRPMMRSAANDLAIARFDAPGSVAPFESFLMTAWVSSPAPQEISFELRRGTQVLARGKRQVGGGLERLVFRDQAPEFGAQAYNLTVSGAGKDPVVENNAARLLVGVHGPRPVLLATATPNPGLARLLRGGGIKVKATPPEKVGWSLEELSGYSAVLLENVPAERIGYDGMQNLAAWVQEAGGGLMVTGGRQSYGPGGYYRSPLEPVLPVSMELRKEHRKLSLAIVVALDRSGSMAVPVPGGRVKMDLANLGTVQVLDMLGPNDELGVIAVDSSPHIIHNLAPVTNKGPLENKIKSIRSEGGGIFVYEALKASVNMISAATAGTKHIILFADAADAEEPGAYQDLLGICKKANITVSVIGLGQETDKDGALLKDIAALGGGRCLFSNNPEELPRLFAQDTFVVARSSFLDEPTPIRATAGLTALAGKSFGKFPAVGGYNLCYTRPGANLAAVTVDEYEAPFIAAWQAGRGRAVCYTGEADGKYTGSIARWKEVGDLFTSLARWTAGPSSDLPGNMVLTQKVKQGIASVELHLDPARKAEAFAGLPPISVLRAHTGQKPRAETARLSWKGPDTLAIDIPLLSEDTVLATVDVPGHGPVSLPPVCLPYSPEFRPPERGTGLAALERMARASGGKERVEVATIWDDMPRLPRLISMAPWLLLAAVVLLLGEIFERRTGLLERGGRIVWERGQAALQPRRGTVSPLPQPAVAEAAAVPEQLAVVPEAVRPVPSGAKEPAQANLLDALRKMRARGRGGRGGSPPPS
jgi:Mg-chelatase subunit ChlD